MSIDLKQDDEDFNFNAGGDLLDDDHRDDKSICGAHGELLCLQARRRQCQLQGCQRRC